MRPSDAGGKANGRRPKRRSAPRRPSGDLTRKGCSREQENEETTESRKGPDLLPSGEPDDGQAVEARERRSEGEHADARRPDALARWEDGDGRPRRARRGQARGNRPIRMSTTRRRHERQGELMLVAGGDEPRPAAAGTERPPPAHVASRAVAQQGKSPASSPRPPSASVASSSWSIMVQKKMARGHALLHVDPKRPSFAKNPGRAASSSTSSWNLTRTWFCAG
jgi:hypothetical protein